VIRACDGEAHLHPVLLDLSRKTSWEIPIWLDIQNKVQGDQKGLEKEKKKKKKKIFYNMIPIPR